MHDDDDDRGDHVDHDDADEDSENDDDEVKERRHMACHFTSDETLETNSVSF